MADRDPAFLWETEALRTSPSPSTPESPSTARAHQGDWMTLRQASDAAGIPLSTVRNWARKGRVPTALEESPDGTRRIVSLAAVESRARQTGHALPRSEPRGHRLDPPAVEHEHVSPPPGTMLVPIAAWDKMLMQLGNLHQAGQELAEARERAARAETEATFLRERLAELREVAPPADSDPVFASVENETAQFIEEPVPVPNRMPRFSAYLWRLAVSDRGKRGRHG
ncbi:MAG TPA: hypothetical protein VFV13_11380 [Acidimicrobiia bacterium]|nr:hypothetical protein [Acidimicrobiia bacterium]